MPHDEDRGTSPRPEVALGGGRGGSCSRWALRLPYGSLFQWDRDSLDSILCPLLPVWLSMGRWDLLALLPLLGSQLVLQTLGLGVGLPAKVRVVEVRRSISDTQREVRQGRDNEGAVRADDARHRAARLISGSPFVKRVKRVKENSSRRVRGGSSLEEALFHSACGVRRTSS